jgi:hypothetical protein
MIPALRMAIKNKPKLSRKKSSGKIFLSEKVTEKKARG